MASVPATRYGVWDLANSLAASEDKTQMVAWSDVKITAGDYSGLLNRFVLVEVAPFEKEYKSVTHEFAQVVNVEDGCPLLQFYNQSGDKDSVPVKEPSIADVLLFPSVKAEITLDTDSKYIFDGILPSALVAECVPLDGAATATGDRKSQREASAKATLSMSPTKRGRAPRQKSINA